MRTAKHLSAAACQWKYEHKKWCVEDSRAQTHTKQTLRSGNTASNSTALSSRLGKRTCSRLFALPASCMHHRDGEPADAAASHIVACVIEWPNNNVLHANIQDTCDKESQRTGQVAWITYLCAARLVRDGRIQKNRHGGNRLERSDGVESKGHGGRWWNHGD